MKNKYTLLFLFLLPFIYSFDKNDSTIDKSSQISKTHTVDTSGFSEAKAYRMLYENQIKSNDAILKTIFYALGGLGGAVLLVFASNWWFNEKKVRDVIKEIDSKIKEVKKDTLAEVTEKMNALSNEKISELNQMQNKLQEEVTLSLKESTLNFNEFTNKIRIEIRDDNKIISENYQSQLNSFNENYRQQILTLNEAITGVASNLKELIKGKEELLKGLILSEQTTRETAMNRMIRKIARVEFYMWEDSGVFRNALSAVKEELVHLLKVKDSPESYELPLRKMLRTLNNCSSIHESDKPKLIEIIGSIPENEKVIELKEALMLKLNTIELLKPTKN